MTETRVIVEIDADQVREKIRAAAVELVEERDRARAIAVRFEQLADAQRALLVRAAGLLRDAGRVVASATLSERIEELELEIDQAVDDVATCACPDGAVDGHVCEASA